jgi:hypothetical protein
MRSAPKGLAIAVLIAAAAVAYFVWKHEQKAIQEERTRQAEEAQEKRIAAQVKEMASKWNAITDWEGSLDLSDTTQIFTVELEKAIVRPGPILIYASVDDVKRMGDTYIVQLSGTVGTVDIRYNLRCPNELAEAFLRAPRDFQDFAVVASIDHVEKNREPMNAASDSRENEFVFVAEGTCKAATFVGSYGPLFQNLGLT